MIKRNLTTLLAGLAVAAAAAPPVASARVNDPRPGRVEQPAIEVVRVSDAQGFGWGDAGIGAAGGACLSLLALGGTRIASQKRSRRVRQIAPLAR
jgi:hypothetical protein